MEAKEMFEKIGYHQLDNEDTPSKIIYEKDKEHSNTIVMFKILKNKIVWVEATTRTYCVNTVIVSPTTITMDLLSCINAQILEVNGG